MEYMLSKCLTEKDLIEKLKFVVFYCGDTENLIEDADEYIQNLLEHFSVVRPICINCRRQGKETKTWGKRLF
jgi:hypothetical protein